MNATRARAIALRYFFLLRGSPARWLPLFVWVSIDILLWGFITKYLNSVVSTELNFVPRLLGAVLIFDFFTRVLHGIASAFLEDVWSRNFLNVFASPLQISEYLGGLVMTSICTSMVGLVIMLLLAIGVFGLSFASYGAMIFPFLLILFLFGIALGIVGCGIVLRLGPASEWFIWPIPAIISPFVGVFYPLSTLPLWMQYIAKLLPPSYVFEQMRRILSGEQASMTALVIGGSLAIAYIALACWLFQRIFKHAVRTGLIARYSAESIS